VSKLRPALSFLIVCSVQVLSCAHNSAENKGFSAPANTHSDSSSSAGLATWYGDKFAGRKTSSGERFDPTAMTAAHRKLKLGTWVEVRRIDTGSTVRVRINDRGPWGDDRRIIDLSRGAAEKLGIVHDGIAKVEVRVVSGPE
jgi:rare lipoprotein A